ncbi:MAG: hypothetical protein SCARUB_00522 [Candidatus Scalindua rubra]|uniref:PIN domain-containing protein n=1 Tax=Candidatus Scalindua rubra TaxID=1872076 RepID=A0A1E3XFI4_9BACT|nr:MAG: hypothetical protein SCARUB_00522 [Candidatus Scalindua rubra]
MEYYQKIIQNYRSRGVLIDSNLLLLYFIGKYNLSIIQNFKRTKKYTIEDFDLLSQIIRYFPKLITTPNILTEVSNLCNSLPGNIKDNYFTKFAKQIQVLNEHYKRSSNICSLDHFKKFGLTDSGIIDLVKGNFLVLSDDLPLTNYLLSKNIDAINFNHLRPLNWDK